MFHKHRDTRKEEEASERLFYYERDELLETINRERFTEHEGSVPDQDADARKGSNRHVAAEGRDEH